MQFTILADWTDAHPLWIPPTSTTRNDMHIEMSDEMYLKKVQLFLQLKANLKKKESLLPKYQQGIKNKNTTIREWSYATEV